MARNRKNWTRETKECENCHKVFHPFFADHRRFCSRKCSALKCVWNRGLRTATGYQKHHGADYKKWSLEVKTRDGFTCKIANKDCTGLVVAHHILPWRLHPELRYEVNNGITLCHNHNPRKHKEEAELSPFFIELIKKNNE